MGTEPTNNFNEPGWSGSFEQEFFPCPMLNEDDDCCNDVVTVNFGRLNDLPFETTCNKDLDAQELALLADYIMEVATEELPACDGIVLNPVAINVMLNFTTCCVENTPCFWLENPCDCYEDFPSPFWGCCEGYVLQLEVKYARTTPCIPPITDSPIG